MRARPLHCYDSVVEGAGSLLRIGKQSELYGATVGRNKYPKSVALSLNCAPPFRCCQKGTCGAVKICEAIGGKVKAIVVCPQTTIGSGDEPIVVYIRNE